MDTANSKKENSKRLQDLKIDNLEVLDVIDKLIVWKTNGQIEKGIVEIQNYIESETGQLELINLSKGSERDKEIADEFNSL